MKRALLAAALGASAALAGCQAHYSKMTWVPIVPVPAYPAEIAMARCEMVSSSVDQGYFAMGSPGFVMGAGIGNAIANDMRRNDFVKQCMTLHGWRGVPQTGAGYPPRPAPSAR